jgi:hypothetical protein
MNFAAVIGCALFLFFSLLIGAFYFQRFRWKRKQHHQQRNLGFYPTFSSLGQALNKLQQVARPQVGISMLEEDVVEADQNEEEIEGNGVQHLHRQLRQIRDGDSIEKLIVLLRLWRS